MRPENLDWDTAELPMDVYVADVVGGVPEPAVNLGTPVNTLYLDGEMAVSRSGDELFVASDRDDPGGDLSIYRFFRDANAWTGPELLGGDINTGSNLQPFLTADGAYLLWTSHRRGFPEIYRAQRLGDNTWGTAERIVDGSLAGSPSMTDDGALFCFASLALAITGVGYEADIYCAERL